MAYLAGLAANSNRWLKILAEDSESNDRDFVAAAREVWDRHKGKPQQSVDVKSSQPVEVVVRFAHEDRKATAS